MGCARCKDPESSPKYRKHRYALPGIMLREDHHISLSLCSSAHRGGVENKDRKERKNDDRGCLMTEGVRMWCVCCLRHG